MAYYLKGKIIRGLSYQIDKTLSVENVGADAKATGDAIAAARREANLHIENKENPHNVTSKQLGLDLVDNTPDSEKPVSRLQAEAIADAKKAGTDAQTAADNAQTAADNAQTAADDAQIAADNAQVTANGKVSKINAIAVLTVEGWADNTQTVEVSGVTADNTVIVGPDPANHLEYIDINARCSGQAENFLTFTCDELPESNLIVNVMILN